MSERKVLNKYYPPDFDPSKIRRRKGINAGNPQITIRLMAPFSMRCTRCGEYVYKGKKFNARKETALNEEYYGIKVFRFYIKCPVCSSEITFKTDPKNADYICEHGATRNFENWAESDPSKRVGAMPDAAADDEYDSEGNPLEDKREKDAMADLERSQEQSRREMEMMDELADLRQRNARLELSGVGADPEALLSALHAERESAEEEARRKMEQEEDDQLVAQYFAKVNAGPAPPAALSSNGKAKDKGKGKAKAIDVPSTEPETDQTGEDAKEANGVADGDESDESEGGALPSAALTIKRRPAPVGNGNGSAAEPSVASILAAKGKALDPSTAGGSAGPPAPAVVKRKREDMQKLLGIKKKK